MPQFIYRANACAVGGRITAPSLHDIEPQASCSLPSSGGRAVSQAGPFHLELNGEFILSFDSAETTIVGAEASPGVHSTLITTVIKNLSVLDILKAEQIVSRMQLFYDTAAKKVTIDTEGSHYTKLTIGGETFNVKLDHALGREAADYLAFRQHHPELPENAGKIRHFLGRHPKIQPEPNDLANYHHPGFGRIYFGEWTAAPKTQGLTMLRLKLGSPAEGDVGLGDIGGNGEAPPF